MILYAKRKLSKKEIEQVREEIKDLTRRVYKERGIKKDVPRFRLIVKLKNNSTRIKPINKNKK